jgi:hypothetical protein
MSLSDGSLCCYKERGCYPAWGFSGGTPGFERPREQQRPVAGRATRRICGSAKGHGLICERARIYPCHEVREKFFSCGLQALPGASAAKAGEGGIPIG